LSRRDYKSSNHLVANDDLVSFYPTGGSHGFTREDGVSPPLKRGSGVGAESGTAIAYRKSARVNADPDSPETWVDDGRANTLNKFDVGDVRTTHAVVEQASTLQGGSRGHRKTLRVRLVGTLYLRRSASTPRAAMAQTLRLAKLIGRHP
jgi:hypothetical protein